MNIIDLTENIAASQKKVKQLPANFRPANTSPQLSGPYPGRNATRGYLVGEDQQTDLGSVFEPNIERTSEYQRGYQSALTAKNPYQEGTTQWTRWLKGKIDKIGPRSKLRPEFGGLPQGSLDKPVSEIYNPVDQERQEQRAMDREREQFKRDELELELSGEEERVRAANEGTFYLRINGRIWSKSGQPVTFLNRERAVRAGQTIKDRDPDREVVVTRRLDNTTPMAESRDPTYEDILTSLQRKLGDYLQDVATAVKKDPDLLNKMPKDAQDIQAVKTIRTDDGHEIKIHGNEDDGFRISIQNQNINSSFRDLDEAVMACEMYCSHRRKKAMEADYIEEKKDACYNKVKSRYKVWPSAYASGALVQCRKKGAKNWGEKSKTPEEVELDESLKNKLAAAGVAATMALSPAHARVTDGGQSFAQQAAQQSSQHQPVKTPKQIPSKSYLQNVASGKSRSLMDPDTAKELLKKYYNEKSQVNEGWREILAALAAAGIMALSPGVSAADVAADLQQVPMIATIVVGGEVKKLDLTAKGFRDVREVEKFFDAFFARQGMPWQGKIERGVPGSGQYQRLIVQ